MCITYFGQLYTKIKAARSQEKKTQILEIVIIKSTYVSRQIIIKGEHKKALIIIMMIVIMGRLSGSSFQIVSSLSCRAG